MKKKIFGYSIFIILSLLFTIVASMLLFKNSLDFLWNFSFGIKVSEGLIPYNDFNMVTTPLFAITTGIILKIFGKNIIIYIIYTSILKIIFCLLAAAISTKLVEEKKEDKSKLFIVTFIFMLFLIIKYYYEYTYFSLFLLLIIIYLELSKNSKKKNFLIGFIGALSFLSKQSIGLFIILFLLLKPIIFKEKEFKKNIIHRIIGIIISMIIFIIYLIITNSFNSFIDYCFLGLFDFNSNKVSIIDNILYQLKEKNYYNSFILILSISIIVIYLLFSLYKIYNKKEIYINKKITFYYALSACVLMYPIADCIHIAQSGTIIYILIISTLANKIINTINHINNQTLLLLIRFSFFIILSQILIYPVEKCFKEINENKIIIIKNYKYINGMLIDKNLKVIQDNIIEFEKKMKQNGTKVVILDSNAVLFHLPQGIFYKDYDLFLNGNFGKNGEERLIEEIKNSKNTIYLIRDDINQLEKNILYQAPKKVLNYVIENLNEIGTESGYIIYLKEKEEIR